MTERHEFVGRPDRWCEVCNLPDRNPIHKSPGVCGNGHATWDECDCPGAAVADPSVVDAPRCDEPMRGMYGAATACARPRGHWGKHDPIWRHTDWQPPPEPSVVDALNTLRYARKHVPTHKRLLTGEKVKAPQGRDDYDAALAVVETALADPGSFIPRDTDETPSDAMPSAGHKDWRETAEWWESTCKYWHGRADTAEARAVAAEAERDTALRDLRSAELYARALVLCAGGEIIVAPAFLEMDIELERIDDPIDGASTFRARAVLGGEEPT